jgi:general stress protein 26
MAAADHVDRVWEVIENNRTCMLVTQFDRGLRARPLQPRPKRDEGVIWFVTDAQAPKDDEIEANPDVCVIFIDAKEHAYLSLSGRAEVVRDQDKAAEVWRRTDDVWWPGGPSDPNACLLRFAPSRAELWDGPASKAVAAFEFAKARATGEEPNLGENRKVTVTM